MELLFFKLLFDKNNVEPSDDKLGDSYVHNKQFSISFMSKIF